MAVCEHYSGGDNTHYTQEEAETVSVVTTVTSLLGRHASVQGRSYTGILTTAETTHPDSAQPWPALCILF